MKLTNNQRKNETYSLTHSLTHSLSLSRTLSLLFPSMSGTHSFHCFPPQCLCYREKLFRLIQQSLSLFISLPRFSLFSRFLSLFLVFSFFLSFLSVLFFH